ncbi:MAG: hypothetical protein ACRDZO_19715 [Egibacteraceae bacterium]
MLQYAGFLFAIFLVLAIPIAEALNVVFASWAPRSSSALSSLQPFFGIPRARIVDFIGLGGIIGLFISGIWLFLLVSRLSTLGTRRFRRRHRQLRVFLASCATDRLARLRGDSWETARKALGKGGDAKQTWDKYFEEWNTRDLHLARACAKRVDKFAGIKAPQPIWRNRPSGVRELSKKVERWALTALLVSERPRQFRLFALPRLAFLYRLYSPMMDMLRSQFSTAIEASIVSTSDFDFTIDNQVGGDHQQKSKIEEWARHQIGQCASAAHLVEELESMGLKAAMTREDFEKMLAMMDERAECKTCDGSRVSRRIAKFVLPSLVRRAM